jgi:nicotinamide-nucleotide amidase
MIVEIVTIGREILDGRVVDTNSVWLALKLKERGLVLRYAQRVDDDLDRIQEAFAIAAKRSQLILVTGGLGPTSDDLTAEAFAEFLGRPYESHPEAEKILRDYLEKRKRPINEAQLKQAFMPRGVSVVHNEFGTAPAFALKGPEQSWYFLPGVPREMKGIFETKLDAELPRDKHYQRYTWITQFTAESGLQMDLAPVLRRLPKNFEVSFRTRFPENFVSLFASCRTPEEIQSFAAFQSEIGAILAPSTYSQGEEPVELVPLFLAKATAKSLAVGFVESCTGGLNTHRLTDLPGASKVLVGSWISYDNEMKIQLGVSLETLKAHGAVSEPCAREMALAGWKKMREKFPTRPLMCLSTTGIAGPDGGSAEKPVGLCFLGVAYSDAGASEPKLKIEKLETPLRFERELNKHFFSQKAYTLALSLL